MKIDVYLRRREDRIVVRRTITSFKRPLADYDDADIVYSAVTGIGSSFS